MWDWCAGAGSWYGVVVSARTRIGSTSESLAQETSAITTTESAETRIIDSFMAGTVVEAAGQFNRRTPLASYAGLQKFQQMANGGSGIVLVKQDVTASNCVELIWNVQFVEVARLKPNPRGTALLACTLARLL